MREREKESKSYIQIETRRQFFELEIPQKPTYCSHPHNHYQLIRYQTHSEKGHENH
jgi:hypothetical protein